jgi:plastocyanin
MRIGLLALTSLAVLGCSSSPTSNNPPPDSDVTIISGASAAGSGAFSPNPFTISLASQTSVKWGNADGITHNVTASDGTFSSGNISSGGTFSHTFTTAGTYAYRCTIHPSMVGSVVVTP